VYTVANPWIYIIFNDQILSSLRDLFSGLFSRSLLQIASFVK
jgi:hypothetical protein